MNKQIEALKTINTAIESLLQEDISMKTLTKIGIILPILNSICDDIVSGKEPDGINLAHEMAGGLTEPSF